MEKTEIIMNKPVYVGFSIVEISKFKMYNEKAKLCYMDIDSFIVSSKYFRRRQKRFHSSNYEVDRPLHVGKK